MTDFKSEILSTSTGFARRILREVILFAAMLAVSWALFAYVLPFFGVNT